MKALTPAEQYDVGVATLQRGIDDLLAREESAAADVESNITTAVEALTTIASAYVDRANAVHQERAAAVEAAAAMNRLAACLGIGEIRPVPPSRLPEEGPAAAVERAAERGVAAVVFELASLVAERVATEM